VARRIELLPRAEKELAALPVAVQDQIIAKLEMLRDFPELGVAMFDAFEGYRALLAARRSYRIVYRTVSEQICSRWPISVTAASRVRRRSLPQDDHPQSPRPRRDI
jgi:mRNA-degrading endonuclease RelE of RelBE toxin-antitoxin system